MSLRWNGSTLGKRDEAENFGAANGVWSLRSAEIYQRDNQWNSVSPLKFPFLALWLDAADSSTLYDAVTGGSLVAANGAVSRWEDKSGNGRHFVQGTANNRPLRLTSQFNSKDALDFDGDNDKLFDPYANSSTSPTIGTLSAYINDTTYSAFVVARADTVSTNSTNTYANEAFYGDGAGYLGGYLRSNNTVGIYSYLSAYATATQSYTAGSLAVFGFEHSAGSVRIRLNGNSEATSALTSTDRAAMRQYLQIGRQWNTDTNCFDGKICEVIFYQKALAASQRQAIEGYLAHKWGLSASLPSTHPYRNVST